MNRASRLILFILAIGIFSGAPAIAQGAAPSADSPISPYDISKEITVQGTIQKIETSDAASTVGMHILIQTSNGIVDAQLGFGAAAKAANLGISEDQNVTVIGMMQSLGGNSLLLARVLTTSSRVFILRSERGIPVRAFPSHGFRSGGIVKGAF